MPADSMTDQNFHEIQLSGKQLVFVFMSAVVVGVVIFLLGVSVGRGVRDAVPAGTDVSAAPATEPATPAPTGTKPPSPGDLTYHEVLQGKSPAPAGGNAQPPAPPPANTAAPPATVATPPAAAAASAGTKASDAGKGTESTKGADTKAADTKTGAKATTNPPAASGWFVQVNVLSTKESAEKQVQQLKAKSFSAFVYAPAGPTPRFHVRLGPFPQRAEAERMAARLAKEGHTPLITR